MSKTVTTPKHFWFVGAVATLWNMMGPYDYLMTQTRNAAYMAKFDQAQLDYFYGFPVWVESCWAIAVWGGLLGSILLLMKKGLAVPVFLVSLVAMVCTAVYNFGLSDGMTVMGTSGLLFTIVIFLICLGLWLYSRSMKGRGVLS